LRRRRGRQEGSILTRLGCLAAGLQCGLGYWRSWRLGRWHIARPAQATPRILDHLRVRVEEFVLESRQLLVVQAKLELQGVIGHPAPLLEEGHDMVEYGIKIHHDSSPGSCTPLHFSLARNVKPPERPGSGLVQAQLFIGGGKVWRRLH